MSLAIVALAVLVLCLAGLGVVIGRKFPVLARLNVADTSSPHEERKKSLIEERLRRKVSSAVSSVSTMTGPVGQRVQKLWAQTHQRLVNLEHEYKIRSLPVFLNRRQRHKVNQEISELLDQARAMLADGETTAAEEKCLQAIRLEPRSVPAFELLGQIYVQTNENGHAKEVYQYLLKLTGDTDAIYEHSSASAEGPDAGDGLTPEGGMNIDRNHAVTTYHLELSQIYRSLGEGMKAFANAQEASRIEPNNPKVLDELIEASIMAGKKQFAADAVDQLASVNPDNGNIAKWRDQIESIESRSMSAEYPEDQTPSLYETHNSPNERS